MLKLFTLFLYLIFSSCFWMTMTMINDDSRRLKSDMQACT